MSARCLQAQNTHRPTFLHVSPFIMNVSGNNGALKRSFFHAVCLSVCAECLPISQAACLCRDVCVLLLSSAATLLPLSPRYHGNEINMQIPERAR